MLLDQAQFINSQSTRISKKDTHTKLVASHPGTATTLKSKGEGNRNNESNMSSFKDIQQQQESSRRHHSIKNIAVKQGSTSSGRQLKETGVSDDPKRSGILDKPVIYFPTKASRKSSSPQSKSSIVTCVSSGDQKLTTASVVDSRIKNQTVKPLFVRRKVLDGARDQLRGLFPSITVLYLLNVICFSS